MTRIAKIQATCLVCGERSTHRIMLSTFVTMPPDLDGRENNLGKSTETDVQRCPSCGYCARSIEDAVDKPTVTALLALPEYPAISNSRDVPPLAAQHLCASFLRRRQGQLYDACKHAMCAAWACDDVSNERGALMCRQTAIEIFEAVATGEPLAIEDRLVLIDLRRRIGDFQGASKAAAEAMSHCSEEHHMDVVRQQEVLIANADTRSHMMHVLEPSATVGSTKAKGARRGHFANTARVLFILAAIVCASLPWLSHVAPATPKWLADNAAPIALTLGMLLAICGLTPFPKQAKSWSKLLIQGSVVLLGFSMSLGVVVEAGLPGLAFAAGTIVGTIALGFALGAMLNVEPVTTALLSAGTSICGGSAIAATAPVVRASPAQMSVSLACVFMLNALALYVFPHVGRGLGMSEHQFGAWAAVAIHDVSSVTGAAKQFGENALQHATVIKLTRALWIAPVAIALGWLVRRMTSTAADSKPQPLASAMPWFILFFVLASALRTVLPSVFQPLGDWLKPLAKTGLVLALFLIGSGLSISAIKQVGWRPLVLAVVMWVTLAVASLLVVRATIV